VNKQLGFYIFSKISQLTYIPTTGKLINLNYNSVFGSVTRRHTHHVDNHMHTFKLYNSFNHITTRISFFSQRVIGIWNSYVDFRSLSSFKMSLSIVNWWYSVM